MWNLVGTALGQVVAWAQALESVVPNVRDLLKTALGQMAALAAFFGFPALRYWLLKRTARGEGQPQLWYLPAYGFRLVIRNLPKKRTLTGLRYRCFVRMIAPACEGSSVATFVDKQLVANEEMFLFPGTDQILICFRLVQATGHLISFVHTDKLGNELSRCSLSDFNKLVADYEANVKNLFNFDVKIAKRAELDQAALGAAFQSTVENNTERTFGVSRIRDVG